MSGIENLSIKMNNEDDKKIKYLNSIWNDMKKKMNPIPEKFNIKEINNMINNNLNINEDKDEYMVKAYKYYQDKKVPKPYDLYILTTDEYLINKNELQKCKDFDFKYDYKRMFGEETYKTELINYKQFFDFDDTKKWKQFLNTI